MRLLKTNVYVGPNIYSKQPLIRLTIDVGRFNGHSGSEYQEKLFKPLLKLAPSLGHEHDENGRSLIEGFQRAKVLDFALLTAHLALALQHMAEPGALTALSRETKESGIFHALFGYVSPDVGVRAGGLARRIVLELVDPDPEQPFDCEFEVADFLSEAGARKLGPSATALVRAAELRGIPWMRLNNASLIQLGQGRRQRRIEAALTSQTSHIAVDIAKDKELCQRLLHDLGLPVPKQVMVRDARGAVRAAHEIGFPVVVKPVDGNHGRGVSINLESDDAVREGYDRAREHSRGVVVESMIEGADHRLLVVGGKLVAAAKRVPAHVVGDGKRTITELVAAVNADPKRGVGHENVLTRIEIDGQSEALLALHGYDANSVPPQGEMVLLKRTANLSTGGSAIDVTDFVHPENRIMAERAINAVGLDVGGIDFLTTDIAKSYRETGGAICEINAGPGIRMHIAPSEGSSRDVAGAIIEMLFPPGTPGQIPIAALSGTNGKTTTARMLAHILKMAGRVVGQTSTDAVSIDGEVTVRGDMTGPTAASIVLRDPSVDVAVLETARGGIVRAGLGFRQCDVGAVLNVTADHLGLGGIETLDELARVKRLIVEVARDTAVLSADNLYTLAMAEHTPAKHIFYVSTNASNAIVREHIKLGKRAILLEQRANGDQIILYDKSHETPLVWTHLIPATVEGKALHNVENAMFAAAMAYSLGLSLDQIRSGLRTFQNSYYQSPGRMNIFDEHGFRVILDYGHNEAAIQQMVAFVDRLKPIGRRIVCLTVPGDRRDEDVRAVARVVAGHFDHYICHRDDDLRGRRPDEIPTLLAAELAAAGVPAKSIEVIPEEISSIDRALQSARTNDVVLMFCGGIARAWKRIVYFRPDQGVVAAKTDPEQSRGQFDIPEGYDLIRDERGVRLQRLA